MVWMSTVHIKYLCIASHHTAVQILGLIQLAANRNLLSLVSQTADPFLTQLATYVCHVYAIRIMSIYNAGGL